MNWAVNCTVVPGKLAAVTLPTDAYAAGVDTISNVGVHVTADQEVAVYGLNHWPASSDGFVGLPVDTLGTSYLAMTYGDYAPQIAVVATQDQTTHTIHGSGPVGLLVYGWSLCDCYAYTGGWTFASDTVGRAGQVGGWRGSMRRVIQIFAWPGGWPWTWRIKGRCRWPVE